MPGHERKRARCLLSDPGVMINEKKRRGFAAMSQDQRREIARKGGQAAQRKGTGHRFTSEEAKSAGRKGGQTVSQDREHMARIGRGGGTRSARVRCDPGTHRRAGNNAEVFDETKLEPHVSPRSTTIKRIRPPNEATI